MREQLVAARRHRCFQTSAASFDGAIRLVARRGLGGESRADTASLGGTASPSGAGAAQAGAQTPITGGTALGNAVWLMMNMPNYRHVFLSDLEWMVLPAILLNQYRLFNADGKVVAFAAWAYLSEAVEKRLQEADPRLAPAEWKSGDRLWLIDLFAPFGHAEAALAELRQSAFAGKSFKMHRRNPDGTRVVVEMGGARNVATKGAQ
jgi:cytolysin-activating lysine-acyltransferase